MSREPQGRREIHRRDAQCRAIWLGQEKGCGNSTKGRIHECWRRRPLPIRSDGAYIVKTAGIACKEPLKTCLTLDPTSGEEDE